MIQFARHCGQLVCFIGFATAFTIVVCEIGVWIGVFEKEEDE